MMFYIGLHHPNHAQYFDRAFISINRVRGRKKPVPSKSWILDSGAFSELERFGKYRSTCKEYAKEINDLAKINPGLKAAVSQDYMCEEYMLEKTGLTIEDHQRLTIERYDALLPLVKIYLMPVLQGYSIESYISHLCQYGDRLRFGMYVGIGSVCKRSNIRELEAIFSNIKRLRPDLKLHGFGMKISALGSGIVRDCLYSADSMAWSFAARKAGRDQNSWKEAQSFLKRIDTMPVQFGWQF